MAAVADDGFPAGEADDGRLAGTEGILAGARRPPVPLLPAPLLAVP